ncbi:hypothetical protein MNBD_GAMMA26-1438 [hydrothermal vent metagenome]|uniref:Phage shock protein A n=1 Tax=hydrothermal vent metagenome TaxID=652676 RepID=A0A3B1ATR2_9ZZZZ
MALITRVSRLFRADFNAVLDHIEEPDLLLKQAIREMEEALAQDEQQIRLLEHEHGQLKGRESSLNQSLAEIDEELDLCFESSQEKLARTVVKRKLEMQQFYKNTVHKRHALAEQITGLKSQLQENRDRLSSMQQKAELFTDSETAQGSNTPWEKSIISIQDEDIDIAFLKEQQKRNQS